MELKTHSSLGVNEVQIDFKNFSFKQNSSSCMLKERECNC